ncbi:MAG: methionyl aminopeptidase [Candidatus Krumholzibacteriia bacterium]|jgi:methionyl aminopeptidase
MSWSKQQINLKSAEQVDKMQASAEILASVFLAIREMVAPGVTTNAIDEVIEARILEAGCIPSFKGYHGFPASACISVNEQVVHGIPNDDALKSGDIVGIDIGLIKDGWHADSAETMAVGELGAEADKLLTVTKECLARGIEAIAVGERISVIGTAIEKHARENGFTVVESLVGHGIGRDLHEDPQVPNYRCFTMPDPVMEEGLVIAIEPMINCGTKRVVTARDEWTIVTADRRLSAHFEHTVAVLAAGPKILTRRGSGVAAF